MTNQSPDSAAQIAAVLEALADRLDKLERDTARILELVKTNDVRIGEAWRYGD